MGGRHIRPSDERMTMGGENNNPTEDEWPDELPEDTFDDEE